MPFRTIKRTADTGGLDREEVRRAVIRVRDRRLAHAEPASLWRTPQTRPLVARERPLRPYGGSTDPAPEPGSEGSSE